MDNNKIKSIKLDYKLSGKNIFRTYNCSPNDARLWSILLVKLQTHTLNSKRILSAPMYVCPTTFLRLCQLISVGVASPLVGCCQLARFAVTHGLKSADHQRPGYF